MSASRKSTTLSTNSRTTPPRPIRLPARSLASCKTELTESSSADALEQGRLYLNAQTNLATAPNQVQTAKKNYVLFTQGQVRYDEQVDNDLTKKAKELASFYSENFNKECQNVFTDIETYSGLLANLRNVFDLYVCCLQIEGILLSFLETTLL